MAAKTSLPLPLPSIEYNQSDEAVTRRLIEQTIQDINNDIGNTQDLSQSNISKAIRRHQFLLMGVKHG
jgi:hypothetical protein|tara:strand:- start:161 stop:364 length:204 start_codon:yes stop_codon:yes gene_type:complete